MNTRRVSKASVSVARLAFTSLALSLACLEPEVLALNHDVYMIRDGVETTVSSGCTELEDGLGFGFGTGPEPTYSVEYSLRSDGAQVRVSGEDGVLVERDYSEEFLASGREDEVLVAIADDLSLRLVNSGSLGCDDEFATIQ